MPLSVLPWPGTIVICDFAGHVEPEMVKQRRVVVVSASRDFDSLSDATVIVVPLSEAAPRVILPWHHPIPSDRYPGVNACWAKGDLVAHVRLARLDAVIFHGRSVMPLMNSLDLLATRSTVLKAIGLY